MPYWKLWKKEPLQSLTLERPFLPQEIIDQIIQEVASLCYVNNQPMSLEPLKTCSLVSKSFHTTVRRQFFSRLDFAINKYSRRRADRLLKILVDDSTLRNIRTFKVLCKGPISEQSFHHLNISDFFSTRFRFRKLGARRTLNQNDCIYSMLEAINRAPLSQFTLVGWRLPGNPMPPDIHFLNNLLQMLSNPALRSIRFGRLYWPPLVLIKHAFYSPGLKRLALADIYWPRESHHPQYIGDTDNICLPLAPLERLDLIGRVPYIHLLSLLRTLAMGDAASLNVAPKFPQFSHLRKLVVTVAVTEPEMNSLWEIMLGVAPFLENLLIMPSFTGQGTLFISIHSNDVLKRLSRSTDYPWPSSVCLSHFTALHHLHFTVGTVNLWLNWESLIVSFLSSASAPMLLETVIIDLCIQLNSPQHLREFLLPSNGWSQLDDAINNRMFVHLTTVICNIRPFCTIYALKSSEGLSEDFITRVNPISLLPRTASSPVNLHLRMMPVRYQYWLSTYTFFDDY